MAEPADKWKRHARVYPELLLLPSDVERKQILQQATRALVLQPLFVLKYLLVVMALTAALIFLLDTPRLAALLPKNWPGSVSAGIAGGVAGATSMWLLQYLRRNATHRFLRQRLLELRIPVCQGCGYDLRGQTTPRCPECGRGFAAEILTWRDGPA